MKLACLTVALTFVAIPVIAAQSVSVQVVDVQWFPAPGVTIQIAEVGKCGEPGAVQRFTTVGVADSAGAVSFDVSGDRAYVIRADANANGFGIAQKCVYVSTARGHTVYLQLRLVDFNESFTLSEPSVSPKSSKQTSATLLAIDFAGRYVNKDGVAFIVNVHPDGRGLELVMPGGGSCHFATRTRNEFRGPDGAIAFDVQDGRVRGLVFSAAAQRSRD